MNYNSLMNKPTINYRELIGDNTVTEVGGITEEQFNTLLNTDLSSYYTKAQIDDLFSRSFVYREKSGSIVTFDCPESTTSGITKVVSDIVAVQSGTGDPSPTNIRPISGWSAVNAYRTGKNLFDKDTVTFAEGFITSTGEVSTSIPSYEHTSYIKVNPNTNYVFSGDIIGANLVNAVAFYNSNKEFISRFAPPANTPASFTTPNNCVYISTNVYNLKQVNTIQLEEGIIATEYEPFGTTYTTTLKDGQGNPLTCYGGELSNENGVQTLTVTHGYIASYNGETLPSTWISDRDVYAEGTTPTTGAEVVYALATTQQITQDTLSITSIAGINNIWCDSGDITVKALDRIIQG